MQYAITFLEGVITFISPCLLPMLPVYISYFAGGEEQSRGRILSRALAFVLGFTAVFVALGALAGTLGGFVARYRTVVNVLCGAVVVFFGLNFLGVFRLRLFSGGSRLHRSTAGFWSALLFGMIFALGWTPCVGAFLGSALLLASQQGQTAEGMLLLLSYSLGLGVPFLLSAVLIDRLRSAFDWVRRHYRIINTVSGLLLIAVGILMATGLMGRLLNLLS